MEQASYSSFEMAKHVHPLQKGTASLVVYLLAPNNRPIETGKMLACRLQNLFLFYAAVPTTLQQGGDGWSFCILDIEWLDVLT